MEMTVTSTNLFDQISVRIIKEQELLIGPLAWDEARKVAGLKIIDQAAGKVEFDGDPKEILTKLVDQYARLFGRASTAVCRQAVQDLIVEMPKDQVPEVLQ
jgi:hypothetical protein